MANVETLLIVAAWLRERCQSPGSSRRLKTLSTASMSDTIPPEIAQDTTAPEKMAEAPYVAMGYCPPFPRPAHVLPNAPQKDAIHGDPHARAFQKRKKCQSRPQAHAHPPCLNKTLLICTLTRHANAKRKLALHLGSNQTRRQFHFPVCLLDGDVFEVPYPPSTDPTEHRLPHVTVPWPLVWESLGTPISDASEEKHWRKLLHRGIFVHNRQRDPNKTVLCRMHRCTRFARRRRKSSQRRGVGRRGWVQ
jgi:hypothetical protein